MIATKIKLLKEMEQALYSEVTAHDMSKVLSILSDKLQSYELTATENMKYESDDLFNAFIDAMEVQGRSKQTIERYKYIINKLVNSLGVQTRSVTVYHLRNYLQKEKARGISDSTLDGLRQVFSSYFGWLWRENLIEQNPVLNIGKIKCLKKEKEVFSDTDIERLKNACNSVRDKAIVCLLKSTACRISEITGLNRDDIDLNSRQCIVLGKGNKQRVAYMSSVAAMLLKEYLSSRTDNNPALLIGLQGKRLQPGGVRQMLKTLEAKTGVTHVHPHKFRRTEITELVRRGMPIEQVKAIAGHEKIDTTMEYVVLDKAQVENSYRRFA